MADELLTEETFEEEEYVFTDSDLNDFQRAIIELAGEYAHLPLIGIVGALHTAAHLLTASAFGDDEEEEEEEDRPLGVSFAVDEPSLPFED